MADIRHRVGIAAPQARVYEALTTTEGISHWMTRDVEGDPNPGGTLRFFFGDTKPGAVMEVAAAEPERRVEWRCVGGADEWVGTTLTLDLKPAEGETVVLFTHAGWREPSEFMHHCSTKWAQFIIGLKTWLEGGESTAWPNDMRISSWS